MGSNITKVERNVKNGPEPLNLSDHHAVIDEIDPRSPTFCRTPLTEILTNCQPITRNKNLSQLCTTPLSSSNPEQNPTDILKSKFIRGLQENLLDPRSPSEFINRTPIIFNDSTLSTVSTDISISENDQVVNLNDSFANLEISNKVPSPNITNKIDISEEILGTLHLKIGSESTPVRNGTTNDNDEFMDNILDSLNLHEGLANKHIERVKNPINNLGQNVRNIKLNRIISQETENQYITPTKRSGPTPTRRTPLSSVGNRSNFRSKSVENLENSPKAKIRPLCYDDNIIDHQKIVKKCVNKSPAFDCIKRRQDSRIPRKHMLRKV